MPYGKVPMMSSLKAKIASWLESGCAVENGEYGSRFVPAGEWCKQHFEFVVNHNLKEIHCNRERGFISHGNYSFLEKLQEPLVGIKIVDSEAIFLEPCLIHAKSLRALDLSFVGTLKQPLPFERFVKLERLSVLVPVPRAESLFQCSRLERLALSRYSGQLTQAQFANLKSLKVLFLSAVQLADLVPLQELVALEALTIAGAKGMHSIDGIKGMHQLKSLTIESSRGLGSLQPIDELVGMERLWLYNCGRVDSLKPLQNLIQLREVTISGNTTVVDGDLSVLCKLPQLKTICVAERKHYRPQAAVVNRNG